MKKKITIYILVMLFGAIFLYCGPSYVMDTPDGFAHFHKEKQFLKYISSDGVRIKASFMKNEPQGDVSMWQNALEKYLAGKGYHLHEKNDIATIDNLKGVYSEYIYMYNAEPYIYGLALFAKDEHLFLIETGGPKQRYLSRRAKILSAIGTFKVK